MHPHFTPFQLLHISPTMHLAWLWSNS